MKRRLMELYCLTFANGKGYVGMSVQGASKRFAEHAKAQAAGNKALVYRAWRKYGEPSLAILGAFATLQDLSDAERAAVAERGTLMPRGYNMTPGGDANPMTVPEIARRVAEKQRGRRLSEETKLKIAAKATGRATSQKVREQRAEALRGRSLYERTDEHRRHLSEVRKEHWERMRVEEPEALQASIAKQSESLKRAWARRKAAA